MSLRAELRRQAREPYGRELTTTVHAVCARCGRRTYLTRPARLCDSHCMLELLAFCWAAAFFGMRA